MKDQRPGLRERTRRAVQTEISEAALTLFAERGFEATTIDDIAAAVGMSQRSVFRYFATKEDIVIGQFGLVTDAMLDTLQARPGEEPPWTTLRHTFEVFEDQNHPGLTAPISRLVFETPALLAAYLQKLQSAQDAVSTALTDRATASGHPYRIDDPTPRVLTAAAFGCLVAAQYSWLASGAEGSFADALDRAMAVIVPR